VLFKAVATREFSAVVEGDGVASLLVQFLETLFDFLMHVVGILAVDLHDDREPRLAIDQRCQTPGARRTQHRVALEIAQPQSLLDDLGAIRDAGPIPSGDRVFPPVRTLAATA